MAKKGRPIGHRLNEESKHKIRDSRMGQTQSEETKNKIAESIKKYFRTPAGRLAIKATKKRMSEFSKARWENFAETESFEDYCEEFSDLWSRMTTAMHRYNERLKEN